MSIQKILISQQTPHNTSPFVSLTDSYGVNIEFRQFFKIEPLSSREFRAQRINVLDYTAVVFSSRLAIDAYFHLCEELRVKVPETMKYFCSTEAVAMYLQNHIVYRKRKIFYGSGTPQSIIEAIGAKHKGEKFLITTSDSGNSETLTKLFAQNGIDYTTAVFVKSVSQDLRDVDLHHYDAVVMCNPSDVSSLRENFPEFKQNNIKFISYGRTIVKAMEEAGLEISVKAPSPDCTSVARAVEALLKTCNV